MLCTSGDDIVLLLAEDAKIDVPNPTKTVLFHALTFYSSGRVACLEL